MTSGWIELDALFSNDDEAFVRGLVRELGADWEVRVARGRVGIDPVSVVVIIAVPFSIFFKKFLELAATDSYGAAKDWLIRLKGRRRRTDIEIRDDWSERRILLPADAPDEAYRQLVPHLVNAMMAMGTTVEAHGDEPSLDQAERWYRQAAEADDPRAMCYLIAILERRGGEARMREAAKWYERAGELLPLSRSAEWVAARHQMRREESHD